MSRVVPWIIREDVFPTSLDAPVINVALGFQPVSVEISSSPWYPGITRDPRRL